jgi:hypothetical protein
MTAGACGEEEDGDVAVEVGWTVKDADVEVTWTAKDAEAEVSAPAVESRMERNYVVLDMRRLQAWRQRATAVLKGMNIRVSRVDDI